MKLLRIFGRRNINQLASDCEKLAVGVQTGWDEEHKPDGTHGAISVDGLTWDGDTQTTVGAAGGASALPATPSKYIEVTIDGTDYVIPVYAKS